MALLDEKTPPRLIRLAPAEVAFLGSLVRDGRTEQRIARRARILLAMVDSDTIVTQLAEQLGQGPHAPNTLKGVRLSPLRLAHRDSAAAR